MKYHIFFCIMIFAAITMRIKREGADMFQGKRIRLLGAVVCTLCVLVAGCSLKKEKQENVSADVEKIPASYSQEYQAIIGNGMIFELDEKEKTATVSSYYDVEQTEFTVPAQIEYKKQVYSVTEIGESAFESNPVLESVQLGSNVKQIRANAFYSCDQLYDIKLDDALKGIGQYALGECTGLSELQLPEGLSFFGDYACTSMTGMEELVIPGSITDWGEEVFSECTELRKVTLADGIQGIGKGAFTNCSLLQEVELCDTLQTIEDEAFWGCEDLSEISLPEGVLSVSGSAFNDTNITVLRIPESLSGFEEEMIDNMTGLKEIQVPEAQKAKYEDALDGYDIKLTTYTK